MKNIKTFFLFFCLIIFSQNLFAKSYVLSPIEVPESIFIDIDPNECKDGCLNRLYNKGQYFSFLSKFKESDDKKLLENYKSALAIIDYLKLEDLNEKIHEADVKVALIIPKMVIGRYSVSISNAILSYLISREIDFSFEVFDSFNETKSNIKETYNNAVKSKADFIIAIFTQTGVDNLVDSSNITTPTYIPTINKERLNYNPPKNLYFGGISYEKQIEAIINLAKNSEKILEYRDNGQIGSLLASILERKNLDIDRALVFDNEAASHFSSSIKKEERFIKNSTIILNTQTKKTGLILSQLGYIDSKPKKLLSTQINFNPALLKLAPANNRENLFVVSAIGMVNPYLNEYAQLLNSDLKYDWISYSTTLGVEFGLNLIKAGGNKRNFGEMMKDNQIEFYNYIYTTKNDNFVLYK